MREHSYANRQWKWAEIDFQSEEPELRKMTSGYKVSDKWLKKVGDEKHNNLQMNRNVNEKEVIWGSLVFGVNPADEDSQKILHFFLSENMLITSNLDFFSVEDLDKELIRKNMESADTAVEGMMSITNEIITDILGQIDEMEINVRKLMWKLEKSNGQKVMNHLMGVRQQLLILKNMIISIREMHMVVKEIFGETVQDKKLYKKAGEQLDRCQYLVSEYTQEVATMINFEEIIASVKGNEVMKTLTVITLLFTPISAWGAWWGMNFVHMPELDWQLGYLFAGIFIVINTSILAVFIKKKGWLGDLLSMKKN